MLPVQSPVESPMQDFMMSRCLARQAVPDCIGVCTVASCKDSQALATSHAARGEWPSLIRTHPLCPDMSPVKNKSRASALNLLFSGLSSKDDAALFLSIEEHKLSLNSCYVVGTEKQSQTRQLS